MSNQDLIRAPGLTNSAAGIASLALQGNDNPAGAAEAPPVADARRLSRCQRSPEVACPTLSPAGQTLRGGRGTLSPRGKRMVSSAQIVARKLSGQRASASGRKKERAAMAMRARQRQVRFGKFSATLADLEAVLRASSVEPTKIPLGVTALED